MRINFIALTAISLRLNGYCENPEKLLPIASLPDFEISFDTIRKTSFLGDSTHPCPPRTSLMAMGSEQALRRFKGIIDRGLGGLYAASIGTDGMVTLNSTGRTGALNKQQKTFFSGLSKAISEGELTSLKIYDHADKASRKIVIGELKSHSLDVQDMEALGMGGWITEQGALIHEIYENFLVQKNGLEDDREIAKAHVHATGLENLVCNSNTSPFDREIDGCTLFIPVRTNSAAVGYNHKVELILKKGNIATVIGNERDERTSDNSILTLNTIGNKNNIPIDSQVRRQ